MVEMMRQRDPQLREARAQLERLGARAPASRFTPLEGPVRARQSFASAALPSEESGEKDA
jgi:hypothetical protein